MQYVVFKVDDDAVPLAQASEAVCSSDGVTLVRTGVNGMVIDGKRSSVVALMCKLPGWRHERNAPVRPASRR